MKINEFTVKVNKRLVKVLYVIAAILLFYIAKLCFIDFMGGLLTTEKNVNLVMSILVAFYVLFCAAMTRSTNKVLDKCRGHIEGKERVEFSTLASLINEDVYTIKSEFKILAEENFFCNVEMDEEGIYKKQAECIAIKCDCCGGVTMIEIEKGGICDYCRAPLGKYRKYLDERAE